MKLTLIKITPIKKLFPEYLSPCCSATVYQSYCCHCGQVCKLPFFILSRGPLTDAEAIEIEAPVREAFPVGAELLLVTKK
jgi:hypothetical protein